MTDPGKPRLMDLAIEGSLDAAGFAAFQDELRADPALRREYLDLMALDHLLVELYEVPAQVGLHARALNEGWGSRRRGVWQALGSVGAAVLLLLAAAAVFFVIRASRPEVHLVGSADSRYAIDGQVRAGQKWRVGQELDVRTGVVSLALNPSVEVCLEAPVRVRLLDRGGERLELLEGKAFFQIVPRSRKSDFRVVTPAGVIRDIGTKFGLEVSQDGEAEVHVRQGRVEIDRGGGQPPVGLKAGDAARWGKAGPVDQPPFNPAKFLQSLPWDSVLYEDDFAGDEGSPLAGRQPRVGRPWMVLEEAAKTTFGNGVLDTSNAPRVLMADFQHEPVPDRNGTYIVRLRTTAPRNMNEMKEQEGAREAMTFRDRNGAAVFTLWGDAESRHFWHLRGSGDGAEAVATGVSVFERRDLTLHYEKKTGQVLFYAGGASEGVFLARVKTVEGAALSGVLLENEHGGDLAIHHLSVHLVTYPRQPPDDE